MNKRKTFTLEFILQAVQMMEQSIYIIAVLKHTLHVHRCLIRGGGRRDIQFMYKIAVTSNSAPAAQDHKICLNTLPFCLACQLYSF